MANSEFIDFLKHINLTYRLFTHKFQHELESFVNLSGSKAGYKK